MKQICGSSGGLVGGLSSEMGCVAGDLLQVSEIRIRTTDLEVGEHFVKVGGFFLEPRIFLNNPVTTLRNMIQLVYEIMILIP